MKIKDWSPEQVFPLFLAGLAALSYARLYMLRDVYLDDNAWLLAIYLSESLPEFLDKGFFEMRRAPLGAFLYAFYLPFRFLENPFIVWHTVALALQIATPLVLYALVRRVSGDAWLALLIATILIVVPLDYCVPYLSSINYRIGLLLGLASLYLTDELARRGEYGWRLWLALGLAGAAQYVFIEAAVTYEPARIILLWNRLRRPGEPLARSAGLVLKAWLPFLALAIPLVAYKLLFPPYGIYAASYRLGLASFFNAEEVEGFWKLLRLEQWRVLGRLGRFGAPATVGFALAAGGLALCVFLWAGRVLRPAEKPTLARVSPVVLGAVAVVILASMTILMFLARVPPRLGMHSSHATLMQPGFAILLGMGAYLLVVHAAWVGRLFLWPLSVVAAALVAVGVYFVNLDLDMYAEATRQEDRFWQAFQRRFPRLPERADFLIDSHAIAYHNDLPTYHEWEDLNSFYDLELRLVRLYDPPRPGSKHERRYRVYHVEEMMHALRADGPAIFDRKIARKSHYGPELIDPAEMTVVLYRGGPLLVNREILADRPTIAYREWADKPPPPWTVPLRQP